MATMTTTTNSDELKTELSEQQLRDLILRHIAKWDHACAPDLAGQIGHGVTAKQLLPILDALVNEGLLQHMTDPKDKREYDPPFQTRYELVS